MAGQPAPTDIQMTLTPFFFKSQEQRTFVPFMLDVDERAGRRRDALVRVVTPGRRPIRRRRRSSIPGTTSISCPAGAIWPAASCNRVFMATPGTYDVYIAVKERLPEKAPKTQVAKIGVLKTTSHRAGLLERRAGDEHHPRRRQGQHADAPLSPDEARERPFVFGPQELLPATDDGIQEGRAAVHLLPGLQRGAGPGRQAEPRSSNTTSTGRKAARRSSSTRPTRRRSTRPILPPTFDPAKFPVPGGIKVPLPSFPEGRLPPGNQDHGQGQQQDADPGHQVHRQGRRDHVWRWRRRRRRQRRASWAGFRAHLVPGEFPGQSVVNWEPARWGIANPSNR